MQAFSFLILLQVPWLAASTWPQSLWPTGQPSRPRDAFRADDFTDPHTGFNPFINVPEGTDHSGRPALLPPSSRPPSLVPHHLDPSEGEVAYQPRFGSIPLRQDVSGILPPSPTALFVPRQRIRVFKTSTTTTTTTPAATPIAVDDYVDDIRSEVPLSEGTIWTLVLCGMLLFCALVFFATLLTVCMYKQRRTRVVMSKERFMEEARALERQRKPNRSVPRTTAKKPAEQVKQQVKG